MKGITPIISIIVLLLITVSLAGAAYVFLGGYMTAYTGRAVQVSGICVAGTKAHITVTNMGSLPIDLGTCATTGIDGEEGDCGDLTIVRTDGGSMGTTGAGAENATFDASTIAAAEPSELHKAVFRDPGCTVGGTPRVCTYAFTRAGDLQPTVATVSCSG
jgi:flagellin-like protein